MSNVVKFPLPRPRRKKFRARRKRRRFSFRRNWLVFLAIIVGVSLGSIGGYHLPQKGETWSGKSTKNRIAGFANVIDGDTLQVAGKRIRLYGIDAPESRQKCLTAQGKSYYCGDAATDRLSDLVRWETVSCTRGQKDRYGRILSICYVDDLDLNAELVRTGLAVAYRRYSSKYVFEEMQARLKGLGLWQGQFDLPWDWRRKNRR